LKVAFKISPNHIDSLDSHLITEIGNNEISFLIYTQNPMALQGFYKVELEKNIVPVDYADAITTILNQETVLQAKFASIKVCYNFNTATLIPVMYFKDTEKEHILDLMFGKDSDAYCFQELVQGNDIKIAYRVPSKIYETINNLFAKNNFSHATSAQLQNKTGDALECIVYTNCIKLLLFKNGSIQIVQFFDYASPSDVSYHLLNVCERFEVSPAVVKLVLSGMIELKSNLYVDVHKYFLNISFAQMPADATIAANMEDLPAHFYTNLTSLALCV
jgi:Protein of unknown function (DUF3822)